MTLILLLGQDIASPPPQPEAMLPLSCNMITATHQEVRCCLNKSKSANQEVRCCLNKSKGANPHNCKWSGSEGKCAFIGYFVNVRHFTCNFT